MTKATTISVLMEGGKSIQMYAKFGQADFNLTVQFGDFVLAVVCGYPQEFSLWDDEEFNPEAEHVVTPGDEIIILEAVIKGIKRQAKDSMFNEHCSAEYRAKVMSLCSQTIKDLQTKKAA